MNTIYRRPDDQSWFNRSCDPDVLRESAAIMGELDEIRLSPVHVLLLSECSDAVQAATRLEELRTKAAEAMRHESERLSIREAPLPASLDRYLATGDESGLREMARLEVERVRRLRPYVWALCILGAWAAVAIAVWVAIWLGGKL